MNKWEKFLAVNGLIQADLVKFLGVTRSAVSDLVKYDRNLKIDKMYKLNNNEMGWDTSMLTEEPSTKVQGNGNYVNNGNNNHFGEDNAELIASLRKQISLLEDQVAELKRDKEELRERVRELKNGS